LSNKKPQPSLPLVAGAKFVVIEAPKLRHIIIQGRMLDASQFCAEMKKPGFIKIWKRSYRPGGKAAILTASYAIRAGLVHQGQ
jgi:hypothetical protein